MHVASARIAAVRIGSASSSIATIVAANTAKIRHPSGARPCGTGVSQSPAPISSGTGSLLQRAFMIESELDRMTQCHARRGGFGDASNRENERRCARVHLHLARDVADR